MPFECNFFKNEIVCFHFFFCFDKIVLRTELMALQEYGCLITDVKSNNNLDLSILECLSHKSFLIRFAIQII